MIARIYRKKIITVAGGFDVAKVEAGSMGSKWKSLIVKSILYFSDKVLAVSYSNQNEIVRNCNMNVSKIEMVYHGFEEIEQINLNKKKDIILTIGLIDELSFTRKGIDRFIRLAEIMPEIEFHLIGTVALNNISINIPNNVVVHGHLNFMEAKFIELLESAKIYIQFSKHESFGCSVAEAMQFGCIPIVSDGYSLPEVVGNCGLIINNFENFENIATSVREILKGYNYNQSIECMDRVKKIFSFEKRTKYLLKIIENLI
ncbi:MAG TPA: glycosyltransferase family 4 protein [Ignavibacteriaceae bacterium]|nr:glycosyltransferase family 4 protein [Ignavibacteriaceae bacterium]